MKNKVSAIIVNYKTPQLVIDCLESIALENFNDTEIFVSVIDNNSGDDSYDIMLSVVKKRAWDSWISILPSNDNGGFSYGNNVCLKKVMDQTEQPDFVWFLNPDTFIRKDACNELISFLNENPGVGIAGSRLEDPDGTPQISAFRDFTVISEMLDGFRFSIFSKILSRWELVPQEIATKPHKTAWIAGASMMFRKEVLSDVGYFDENFFLYYEEVDLCLRARRAGWDCWYVPESRVVHLVGAATGISNLRNRAPRRPTYWFESRRLFFLKNYSWFRLLASDFLWMLGYSTLSIRKKLQKKEDLDPPFFLRDFFRNSIFCKGFSNE